MTYEARAIAPEQKRQFETEGYLIVRSLFAPREIAELKQRFMEMSERAIPGHFEPILSATGTDSGGAADPLKRYPRIMHPHRFDRTAMNYMLHPRLLAVLTDLFEEEPLAAQSMFYFKPPGARGQALHQDNFYLKVEPGTCIAAWAAIDDADEENGGMLLVPKTHEEEIHCPELANAAESFTNHFVKVPAGRRIAPAVMEAGDVLFFNGSLIHGSYRNKSKDRFRRAFITHYAGISTTQIGNFYSPLFRADGSKVEPETNTDSGPCGVEHETVYPH